MHSICTIIDKCLLKPFFVSSPLINGLDTKKTKREPKEDQKETKRKKHIS